MIRDFATINLPDGEDYLGTEMYLRDSADFAKREICSEHEDAMRRREEIWEKEFQCNERLNLVCDEFAKKPPLDKLWIVATSELNLAELHRQGLFLEMRDCFFRKDFFDALCHYVLCKFGANDNCLHKTSNWHLDGEIEDSRTFWAAALECLRQMRPLLKERERLCLSVIEPNMTINRLATLAGEVSWNVCGRDTYTMPKDGGVVFHSYAMKDLEKCEQCIQLLENGMGSNALPLSRVELLKLEKEKEREERMMEARRIEEAEREYKRKIAEQVDREMEERKRTERNEKLFGISVLALFFLVVMSIVVAASCALD